MKQVIIEQDVHVPMELLLLADPSEKQISSYLKRGLVFSVHMQGELLGAYVLLTAGHDGNHECCAKKQQGQGIGKQMIFHAIETAKQHNMHTRSAQATLVSGSLHCIKNADFALSELNKIILSSIMTNRLRKMVYNAVI